MGEVVYLPVIRVESDGWREQEARRAWLEGAFRLKGAAPPPSFGPLAVEAPPAPQNPGPIVIDAVRTAARRLRRSLIGDGAA